MATKRQMDFFKIAEVEADDLFEDEGVNWQYCMAYANFVHKEACEFIIHIGLDKGRDAYFRHIIKSMQAFGCTKAFISAYRAAQKAGAVRVLFYA